MSSSQYQSNYSTTTASFSTKRTRSPPPPMPTQMSNQNSINSPEYLATFQPLQNVQQENEDIQEIPLLSTEEEFIQAIKKWVAMDNQIRILNTRIKEARENRQLLTQQIHQYVEDNNLDYPSIEISDGELILCEKREYSSLTFSYIDRCLSQLIKEPAHVERILSELRENRECYIVPDIRRTQRK
jgi:Family of unknown function (DUF5760)